MTNRTAAVSVEGRGSTTISAPLGRRRSRAGAAAAIEKVSRAMRFPLTPPLSRRERELLRHDPRGRDCLSLTPVARHSSLVTRHFSNPPEDQVPKNRHQLSQPLRRVHFDFPEFLRRETHARGREQARGGRL